MLMLEYLPQVLLANLVTFLELKDIRTIRSLSKKFNVALSDNQFWRYVILSFFPRYKKMKYAITMDIDEFGFYVTPSYQTMYRKIIPCIKKMKKEDDFYRYYSYDIIFSGIWHWFRASINDKNLIRMQIAISIYNGMYCCICKEYIPKPCTNCILSKMKNNCPYTIGVCHHIFHYHCIERWITLVRGADMLAKCPLCKKIDYEWVHQYTNFRK
jgi:hypothetical protein